MNQTKNREIYMLHKSLDNVSTTKKSIASICIDFLCKMVVPMNIFFVEWKEIFDPQTWQTEFKHHIKIHVVCSHTLFCDTRNYKTYWSILDLYECIKQNKTKKHV